MHVTKKQFLDYLGRFSNKLILTGLCVWKEQELSRTDKWSPNDDNGEIIVAIQHACSTLRHFKSGLEEHSKERIQPKYEAFSKSAEETNQVVVSFTHTKNPDLEVRLWLGELSRTISSALNTAKERLGIITKSLY